ncbi:hypothetical protein ACHAXN_007027 [Cyclotella atomus]
MMAPDELNDRSLNRISWFTDQFLKTPQDPELLRQISSLEIPEDELIGDEKDRLAMLDEDSVAKGSETKNETDEQDKDIFGKILEVNKLMMVGICGLALLYKMIITITEGRVASFFCSSEL